MGIQQRWAGLAAPVLPHEGIRFCFPALGSGWCSRLALLWHVRGKVLCVGHQQPCGCSARQACGCWLGVWGTAA